MDAGMDLDAYRARIGHAGPLMADAETLVALHVAHVGAVPFENLDNHLGRPIRTEPPSVYAKIVGERRGGYCFEQNGLFRAMLDLAGFRTERRLARVCLGAPPGGRTHLVTLVHVGGRTWLADVGFGGNSLVEPLALEAGVERRVAGDTLRLVPSAWQAGWELEVLKPEGWSALYWFGDEQVMDIDIAIANHFTSTSPDSRFVQNRTLARSTHTERHTLLNADYKRRVDGAVVEERVVADGAEYRALLKERFLLELPDDAVLKPMPAVG